MSSNKRGEGVPVIQIVANTEVSIVVKQGLFVLNRLAEEAVHDVKSGKSDGWNYFVNNYGPNGKVCKPKEWACCFNHGILSHNLIEESYDIVANWLQRGQPNWITKTPESNLAFILDYFRVAYQGVVTLATLYNIETKNPHLSQ
ncbi:hypothetical protein TCAL_16918 [Tigriopus californicus]|uniref:Uncharacterized protein n=1 Tax=Tigriopus californicus TaxID=6832 RepID=A0A553P6V0_TIGCA|nr:hypothetical protein TCAL_16918 [Tigriopus californicus]